MRLVALWLVLGLTVISQARQHAVDDLLTSLNADLDKLSKNQGNADELRAHAQATLNDLAAQSIEDIQTDGLCAPVALTEQQEAASKAAIEKAMVSLALLKSIATDQTVKANLDKSASVMQTIADALKKDANDPQDLHGKVTEQECSDIVTKELDLFKATVVEASEDDVEGPLETDDGFAEMDETLVRTRRSIKALFKDKKKRDAASLAPAGSVATNLMQTVLGSHSGKATSTLESAARSKSRTRMTVDEARMYLMLIAVGGWWVWHNAPYDYCSIPAVVRRLTPAGARIPDAWPTKIGAKPVGGASVPRVSAAGVDCGAKVAALYAQFAAQNVPFDTMLGAAYVAAGAGFWHYSCSGNNAAKCVPAKPCGAAFLALKPKPPVVAAAAAAVAAPPPPALPGFAYYAAKLSAAETAEIVKRPGAPAKAGGAPAWIAGKPSFRSCAAIKLTYNVNVAPIAGAAADGGGAYPACQHNLACMAEMWYSPARTTVQVADNAGVQRTYCNGDMVPSCAGCQAWMLPNVLI